MFYNCKIKFVFDYKDYAIFITFHYENNTLRYELINAKGITINIIIISTLMM